MSSFTAHLFYPLVNGLFHTAWWSHAEKRHHWTMRALRWCAERGHLQAQSQIGHLLYFRGVNVQAKLDGVGFIVRAAEAGDSKAQYQLARIWEQGFQHVGPDLSQARVWYEKAAEQHHPLAISRLISAYSEGGLASSVDAAKVKYWLGVQSQL